MFTTFTGSFLGVGGAIQLLYIVQSLISVCFDSFACVGVYYGVSELPKSVLFSVFWQFLTQTAFPFLLERNRVCEELLPIVRKSLHVPNDNKIRCGNFVFFAIARFLVNRIPPPKNGYDRSKIYNKG